MTTFTNTNLANTATSSEAPLARPVPSFGQHHVIPPSGPATATLPPPAAVPSDAAPGERPAWMDEEIAAEIAAEHVSAGLPPPEDPDAPACPAPTAADLKIDLLSIPPGCTVRFTYYALRSGWEQTFARYTRRSAPSSLQGRVRVQVPAALRKRAGEWRPALLVQREVLAAAGLEADTQLGMCFSNFFGQEAWLFACHVTVMNARGVNQVTDLKILRGAVGKRSAGRDHGGRGDPTRRRALSERALAGFELGGAGAETEGLA